MDPVIAVHEVRGHGAALGHSNPHGFVLIGRLNNDRHSLDLHDGALFSLMMLEHIDHEGQATGCIGHGLVIRTSIREQSKFRQVPDGPDVFGAQVPGEGEGPRGMDFEFRANAGRGKFQCKKA